MGDLVGIIGVPAVDGFLLLLAPLLLLIPLLFLASLLLLVPCCCRLVHSCC
jgi:hypothetical protein